MLFRSIFKYLPQNVSGDALRDAVARMDSIHEYLRKNPGDNAFNACVERFSDEKRSLWVSWLQMPVEFEDVAFELPVSRSKDRRKDAIVTWKSCGIL